MPPLLVFVILTISLVGAAPSKGCGKDRVIEKSCTRLVECKGDNIVNLSCPVGEVVDFLKKKCLPMKTAGSPCGGVADCTGKRDGKYADKHTGCTSYYTCLGNGFIGRNVCPDRLVFNEDKEVCDWPSVNRPCK